MGCNLSGSGSAHQECHRHKVLDPSTPGRCWRTWGGLLAGMGSWALKGVAEAGMTHMKHQQEFLIGVSVHIILPPDAVVVVTRAAWLLGAVP